MFNLNKYVCKTVHISNNDTKPSILQVVNCVQNDLQNFKKGKEYQKKIIIMVLC